MKTRRESSVLRLRMISLAGAMMATASLQAAQFEFSTLIRWGASSGGPSSATNWEMGIGNTAGAWAQTGNVAPHFSVPGGSTKAFRISYDKPTNTATLQVFDNSTTLGTSDAVSFNPAGGAAVAANAIWTLPASSFFVQANRDTGNSTISVSNLTVTVGTLNVLSPFQTGAMSASQNNSGPITTFHSGNVVLVGNSAGNWTVQGLITMAGSGSLNGQVFGLSAQASDVPEPMPTALIGLGLALLAMKKRKFPKVVELLK